MDQSSLHQFVQKQEKYAMIHSETLLELQERRFPPRKERLNIILFNMFVSLIHRIHFGILDRFPASADTV